MPQPPDVTAARRRVRSHRPRTTRGADAAAPAGGPCAQVGPLAGGVTPRKQCAFRICLRRGVSRSAPRRAALTWRAMRRGRVLAIARAGEQRHARSLALGLVLPFCFVFPCAVAAAAGRAGGQFALGKPAVPDGVYLRRFFGGKWWARALFSSLRNLKTFQDSPSRQIL